MAVERFFNNDCPVPVLYCALNSMGAHVASKLGKFSSDERTLTDDACDMFAIWPNYELPIPPSLSEPSFTVVRSLFGLRLHTQIYKTSQREEARIGADFAFRVWSPEGMKEVLIQAKVRDPHTGLRCDSEDEWERVRQQLIKLRRQNSLAFLMIYVPAQLLGEGFHGYPSWEQGLGIAGGSNTNIRLGMTLIAVQDLLNEDGTWRNPSAPVIDNNDGTFSPPGIALGRLFLEMLICQKGKWEPLGTDLKTWLLQQNLFSRFGLDVSYENATNQEWRSCVDQVKIFCSESQDY